MSKAKSATSKRMGQPSRRGHEQQRTIRLVAGYAHDPDCGNADPVCPNCGKADAALGEALRLAPGELFHEPKCGACGERYELEVKLSFFTNELEQAGADFAIPARVMGASR